MITDELSRLCHVRRFIYTPTSLLVLKIPMWNSAHVLFKNLKLNDLFFHKNNHYTQIFHQLAIIYIIFDCLFIYLYCLRDIFHIYIDAFSSFLGLFIFIFANFYKYACIVQYCRSVIFAVTLTCLFKLHTTQKTEFVAICFCFCYFSAKLIRLYKNHSVNYCI